DLEREGHNRHSSGGNGRVADPFSGLRLASQAAACLVLSSALQRRTFARDSVLERRAGELQAWPIGHWRLHADAELIAAVLSSSIPGLNERHWGGRGHGC